MRSGPSNNMQLTDLQIGRWKRDAPPAHFLLKIQSLSQLSRIVETTEVHKYESGVFEVSDYKWKLVVYPNGNARRNGDGYISLYLALAETKPISNGSRVEVTVKFFVYDHIRDNYLTIQDGKVKRFHVLKIEHGVHQLLPLSTFNDSSNGYLVDDCCAFGVEVHLIKPTGKVEELSLTKEPNNASYTWKIKSFSSTLEQNSYYSEAFNAAGYECVFEHGVYAEYKLLVKDQVNGIHKEVKGSRWFSKSASGWGYPSFMLLNDLHNASKGFLVNDTLIIDVKITFISDVKALA